MLRSSSRLDRAGLTSAELLVTLALLGILLALTVPRIDDGLRRVRLTAAVAELTTAHFLARSAAMRYGRPAELHIDAANGRFWVEVDTAVTRGVKDTVGGVHQMATGNMTMTSTRSLLCFDRSGLAYVSGACEAADATIIFSLSGRSDTLRTGTIGKILR
jgi:Tfp pilus assembly protein FimT